MLVKKPARRPNSRNPLPGHRARGQGNGEPGNLRLNIDSNWAGPDRDTTLNTEANQQIPNPHPNQNLGSRFRALAALEHTMDTDNQGLEGEADKDSNSHIETNSSLVVLDQANDWEAGTSRHGNRNLRGKESFPLQGPREARVAGRHNEAQVLRRSDEVVDNTSSGLLRSYRPNRSFSSRDSVRPVQVDGPRHSGLARETRGTRPPPTGLDNPPGGPIHPDVDRGGELQSHAQLNHLSFDVQGLEILHGPIHGNMKLDA